MKTLGCAIWIGFDPTGVLPEAGAGAAGKLPSPHRAADDLLCGAGNAFIVEVIAGKTELNGVVAEPVRFARAVLRCTLGWLLTTPTSRKCEYPAEDPSSEFHGGTLPGY